MTKQEAFNKAYLALKAQGCKSTDAEDNRKCLYRGANGTKCAVGHLLTDEDIEKYGVQNSMAVRFLPDALLSSLAVDEPMYLYFFMGMQIDLHDELPLDLEGLDETAVMFAARWGLVMPNVAA